MILPWIQSGDFGGGGGGATTPSGLTWSKATVAASPYTDAANQDVLFVALTSTINLPAPTRNRALHIKSKGAFTITLARNGSENIEGVAANYVTSVAFGSWIVWSDGTDWWVWS